MKRLIACVTLLILLLQIAPAALASPPNVVDDADLLTAEQESGLSQLAAQLRDTYEMYVVIHTVWSLGGKTAEAYADDFFDYNGYGVGSEYSGVILVLSMEYRDWAISTYGNAIHALSDRKLDDLFDSMSYDLSEGDYYEAFLTYLYGLEDCFQDYMESHASPGQKDYLSVVLISLAVGAGVGLIGLLMLRSGMQTAVSQTGAQSYLVNNSFVLPVNQNTFLYSRTSRMRLPESNGGGGSSTHRGSSGRSHGGRSGKF